MLPNSALPHAVYDLQKQVATENSIPAFEKLYLIFYKDLHRFATGIIKSEHIAEEIVSDVFVQLWKKRAELDQVRQLRVFLYVAVKNLALTYLYKARRQRVCWIEEFASGVKEPLQADDRILYNELNRQIQQSINGLPVKCKAIFLLVREGGLKYAEAARLLNLSVKTIENQMGIALKKIAQQLRLYSNTR